MELYLKTSIKGKGAKGRTAVGSAAYRSCQKLEDNAGNVHDYSHKGGYVLGGIELPEGASEELRNAGELWRRHEQKDIRKDAQLYRDIEFALPNELDTAAAARVAQSLTRRLTERGMCVQWDLHDPTPTALRPRNFHCHMMVTMRDLQADGTFGNKNRSWNKYNGGINIADELRPLAADLMNEELAAIGSDKKVEYKSYEERGVDKIPTKHVGVHATAMYRKEQAKKLEKKKPFDTKIKKVWTNDYIKFLNHVHVKNLREAEQLLKPRSIDSLIAAAEAKKPADVPFKDWDALFAMLRDTRRCRSAFRNEEKKLEKIINAYEKNDTGYLTWAGIDPTDAELELEIRSRPEEIRLQIAEMDATENFLLNSKELFKYHNRAYYTSKQASWDEYRLNRNKQGIFYCEQRLDSLKSYREYLTRGISMLDMIFNTEAYKEYCETMRDLRQQEERLRAELARNRAELKQNKKDLKEHQKEARAAAKAEKQARRQYRSNRDEGRN